MADGFTSDQFPMDCALHTCSHASMASDGTYVYLVRQRFVFGCFCCARIPDLRVWWVASIAISGCSSLVPVRI